jgi:putative transposase
MPWRESSMLDAKIMFIATWEKSDVSFSELCRQHEISRKTGYKLIGRYEAEGVDGLKELSRAPRHHPNAVPEPLAAAILEVRRSHPTWGAKKIRAWLARRRPDERWPVESTISELLDRHGLVVRRKWRRRVPPSASPLTACVTSNDVWGVDFKGWFRTGDGRRCDPFSLSDLHSRFVLRLQVMERMDARHVWPVLDAAFREFGLPRVVRSDNGPPFAGLGAAGLSTLAVRLIKAGVLPERIAPGKPQQNGRHERLHRTVQEDTADPPAANRRAQQRRFDAFRRIFNEERPHEALDQHTPASVYQPPPRAWNGRLRSPDYPDGTEVRQVRQNGEIKWLGHPVFLSETLAGEPIGLTQTADGIWAVRYGPLDLGRIDAAGKFARAAGACPRCAPQPNPPG